MDKLDLAVSRIREASAMSLHYYKKPLVIAYSGGKDSDAVRLVAEIAGIPYEVQHSHTTADAPETVAHVRRVFHDLECKAVPCSIEYPKYKGRRVSMWTLIPQKGMPPTRLVRYCCEILKEGAGKNRFIATGVRWAESSSRKRNRGEFEKNGSGKYRIILNNDNDTERRLFEHCQVKSKRTVNPLIDWEESDVWDFLEDNHCECNPLYCDFSRVGCIGCPMAGKTGREREFLRWPKYRNLYVLAFDNMLKERRQKGSQNSWDETATAEDIYNWWMEYDTLPGQIDLLG